MGVGPATVHALEHLGPVLGFGAAGPGVDLDVAVVAVGLARQQGLQLGPRGLGPQPFQLLPGLLQRSLVPLGVGQLGEAHRVDDAGLQLAHRLDLGGQAVALAHQGLRFLRPVPQGGILRARIQFVEAS